MMDQGHFTQAIDYFSTILNTDTHPHVKLALASAYAGRAGVSMEKLLSLVEINNLNVNFDVTQSNDVVVLTAEILNSLHEFEKVWQKLPKVNQASRDDLQRALDVLANDPTPGVRLYSASLRLIAITSSIHQGLLQFKTLRQNSICSDQLKPYFNWALAILDAVSALSEDLELALPDSRDKAVQVRGQIQSLKSDAAKIKWPARDQCF